MRLILLIFLSFFLITTFAEDHSYDVSGTDENGNEVQGTVSSNNGDSHVSGEITDEDGDSHSFEGQWVGRGHIQGETDEGDSVELDTD